MQKRLDAERPKVIDEVDEQEELDILASIGKGRKSTVSDEDVMPHFRTGKKKGRGFGSDPEWEQFWMAKTKNAGVDQGREDDSPIAVDEAKGSGENEKTPGSQARARQGVKAKLDGKKMGASTKK